MSFEDEFAQVRAEQRAILDERVKRLSRALSGTGTDDEGQEGGDFSGDHEPRTPYPLAPLTGAVELTPGD